MPTKLKVLILEDSAADAELSLHELRHTGYDPEWKRVEREPEYLAQLDQGWEIILADSNLPEFGGLRALELLRERDLDLPFVIVSGTIGEANAVAAMKAGANDFIMKDRLARLGPAVERELRDAVERRERKRAVNALQNSEERFRQLSNLLPQIVFETDFHGNLTFANQYGLMSLGYSREDYESRINILTLVAPEDRERIKTRITEIFNGSETGPREYQVLKKDGRIFPILMHASAIIENGVPIGIRGIAIDITERKRAEEELRRSEERFKLIFENAPDAYYLNDLKGNFIDGNKAAEKITGYKKEELIDGSFLKLKLLSLAQMPKALMLLAKNAMGISTGPDEFILKKKAGDEIFVEISTHPVKLENKIVVLGIARDITARLGSEEALRQAEENYRRSLDESLMGIRVVSANGKTLYANRTILDIYGYDDIDEMNSTPVKNRYTPESYAEYQLRKKERMNGKETFSEYEINIVRKTGEIRSLWVLRKEILWNGQKQFQAVYQDITKRKEAEEKLRVTLNDLSKALNGIFQVLSAATEKRDPYTAGHQRRVADLAQAIGQEMGLPAERVEGLRLAGIVHDIGKISIPAEILSKPSNLTKMEYNLVQCHSDSGHDILKDIDFSWPIAEMVFQHHERMNGSGYPRGLKGEDILLEARILAVSDVVEAMASHRPYRPALGVESAIKEIEKNKGILYDPIVVSACLTLFQEKKFSFDMKPDQGSITAPRSG